VSAIDELRGNPQFRLDEIESLPLHVLRDMVPVQVPQSSFRIVGSHLLAQHLAGKAPVIIRAFSPEEVYALTMFNGHNSLRSIADAIGVNTQDRNADRVFSRVVKLFAELARIMLFVPREKHERETESGPFNRDDADSGEL
jgi:hypothetical protein